MIEKDLEPRQEELTVAKVQEAIRIARRICDLRSVSQSQRVSSVLKGPHNEVREGGKDAWYLGYDQGWQDGAEEGLMASAFDIESVDVRDIFEAVFGKE